MTQQLEESMKPHTDSASWRDHLIELPSQIKAVLENTHRIAVLGIKPDPSQPANYVPEYAEQAGYEITSFPRTRANYFGLELLFVKRAQGGGR